MDYKLDKEEQKILGAFEKGELKSSSDFEKNREMYVNAATNTLKKLKKEDKITIRINHQDLELIRKKANYEGLPYQTLIGSILHKYTHK